MKPVYATISVKVPEQEAIAIRAAFRVSGQKTISMWGRSLFKRACDEQAGKAQGGDEAIRAFAQEPGEELASEGGSARRPEVDGDVSATSSGNDGVIQAEVDLGSDLARNEGSRPVDSMAMLGVGVTSHPEWCGRCQRIGIPLCAGCRKKAGAR